jgi:hypothetical protein
MAAATAIPLVGAGLTASAQTPVTETTIAFKYAHYEEYQGAGEGRMRVSAPMAWMQTPIGSRTDLQSSFVYDGMSGASTYYLDSRTGASGLGVRDERLAGDVKATHYFDRVSVGVGLAYSDEDDYTSRSALLEGRVWSEDKNTTFTASASLNNDDISSTNDPTLDETRDTALFLLGLTQVIDENSLVQINTTASIADGYLTDPYKTFDKRPESRDAYAFLVRYIHYIEQADASLHVDYRYYTDSWNVQAHTVETSWYQPLGAGWMIRPRVRYYSQERASFFTTTYPPEEIGTIYSTDQRLSDFGGLTTGMKLMKDLPNGYSANCSFDFQHQRDNFKLGGHGSSEIDSFSTWVVMVGLSKKF